MRHGDIIGKFGIREQVKWRQWLWACNEETRNLLICLRFYRMSKKETSWKEWVWNEEATNMVGEIGSLERRKKKRTGIMRNLE